MGELSRTGWHQRRAVERGAAVVVLAALALAVACADLRPLDQARRRCVSWVEEIEPLLEQRCGDCHGEMPDGAYSTVAYLGVLGTGSDEVANALAGDGASLLLQVVEPGSADETHASLLTEEELALLREWVVDCRLSYFRSGIHPGGIMNPTDEQFHGELLRSSGWDFELCASCHGQDFAGGKADRTCLGCHTEGPTACNVCHGSASGPAPPRALDGATETTALGVGAHQSHLLGEALRKPLDCADCHVVPTAWDDPGHIFVAEDVVDPDPTAELVFDERAGASATWNRDRATCSAVYCHGGTFTDSAADETEPTWTEVGTGQAACGACHGLPPSSHAGDQCAQCHPLVVDALQQIIDFERHFDGHIDVGDGTGSCSACHGDADSPAPPRDLAGNTATSALGVGAHRAHLDAWRLRGPIPCEACHREPSQVTSPGHIDSGLPAELVFGALATADGAMPEWDRDAATCAGVYCHGGGTKLSGDAATGLNRTPQWTAGATQAACGRCHGLPPEDGVHPAGLTVNDCVTCHSGTIDASGQLLISGGTSKHINGVVDVP